VICPHCKYTYQMDLAKYKENLSTVITRGLFGKGEPKPESSKYVDLKCPVCNKGFEWKVE
jgi:hypothetical protein